MGDSMARLCQSYKPMLYLTLMRHAKTESFSESGSDYNRELTSKGLGDATKMASKLGSHPSMPQQIHCSSAMRTKQTWQHILPAWNNISPHYVDNESLYLASAGALLNHINGLKDTSSAMFLGHNPGLHDLVQILSGSPIPQFSPSTCAILRSEHANWEDVTPESMELVELLTP